MAVKLKRNDNGTFDIRTEEQARKALEGMANLQAEIAELQAEHGISEMMDDAAELKKGATEWAKAQRRKPGDQVRIECDGFHAVLIEQAYDARFIATEDDLTGDEPTVRKIKPLRAIIRKKFGPFTKGSKSSQIWKRITKSVVDKDALDEVVAEGLLTVKEITPAFVEKKKAPFLRVFHAGDE